MKIAVPTRDGRIDDHFGHCDHYTIFEIEDKKVVDRSDLINYQIVNIRNVYSADAANGEA